MAKTDKKLAAIYREIYNKMIISALDAVINGDLEPSEAMGRAREFENFLAAKKISIDVHLSTIMKTAYNEALEKEYKKSGLNMQLKKYYNFTAIDQLIKEKVDVQRKNLDRIKTDMTKDFIQITKQNSLLNRSRGDGAFQVARRILDDVRNIGMGRIQEKILNRLPFTVTEKQIFNDLQKLMSEGKIIGGRKVKGFGKVQTLDKIDDPKNSYFKLRTRSGNLRWYNTADYAHLVSVTTHREATFAGVIDVAKGSSNLIWYNYTGKPYAKIGDPCSMIDGQIFSTNPRGTKASNGKIYPYYKEALKSKKYLVPHPNCRHAMSPIMDTPEVLERYDAIAARNKYGLKPREAA